METLKVETIVDAVVAASPAWCTERETVSAAVRTAVELFRAGVVLVHPDGSVWSPEGRSLAHLIREQRDRIEQKESATP